MDEKKFNESFGERLSQLLSEYDMTRADLARRLNVSHTSVSSWCAGIKVPRMDKIDMMCRVFNVSRTKMLTGEEAVDKEKYYLDEETAQMAQEIHDNPQLKICFDAIRNVSAKDLAKVEAMIKIFKGTNNET